MRIETEKKLMQAAIALGCIVPLAAGGDGMAIGPDIIRGVHAAGAPIDLDSHFRYLSGLLFGLGIVFLSCIPGIESKGARLRALGFMVVIGGLARLASLVADGMPGPAHRLAFGMELGVVPLLMIWQARLARRWRVRRGSVDAIAAR